MKIKIKILKDLLTNCQESFLQIAPAAAMAVLAGMLCIVVTIGTGYLCWLFIARYFLARVIVLTTLTVTVLIITIIGLMRYKYKHN